MSYGDCMWLDVELFVRVVLLGSRCSWHCSLVAERRSELIWFTGCMMCIQSYNNISYFASLLCTLCVSWRGCMWAAAPLWTCVRPSDSPCASGPASGWSPSPATTAPDTRRGSGAESSSSRLTWCGPRRRRHCCCRCLLREGSLRKRATTAVAA